MEDLDGLLIEHLIKCHKLELMLGMIMALSILGNLKATHFFFWVLLIFFIITTIIYVTIIVYSYSLMGNFE